MKFSTNSKILLSRLLASGKAIDNRPAISILGCFLLSLEEADGDTKTLSITASNVENTVVSSMDVSCAEGHGKVCIDAKRLTELLKSMPDCMLSFDIDEASSSVIIRHSKGKFNFSCFPGSNFPINDEIDPTTVKGSFSLPASTILSAFDKVSFAIGDDAFRPQMSGIFWDIALDAVTFVATDTRVLAKYRNTQPSPGVETSFILPWQSISLIGAFIVKQSEINIVVTHNKAIFKGSDFTVQSVLINGTYPPYNRVIPQNPPFVLTVDRNDFYDAVGRVAICSDSSNTLIRFKLTADQITTMAQDFNYNVGGEECIECEYYGDEMEIGFSYNCLKGLINSLNTQKMVVKLISNSQPVLFTPAENDEYGELTLLCMPIHIQDAN